MAGAKRKDQAAKEKAAESNGHSAPDSSKKRKKKGDGWPWWLYAIGGFALCVVFGGAFVDSDSSSRSSKASSSGKQSSSAGSKDGKVGTADFLTMAMRLQEMTTIAATLQGAGELDEEVATELDEELKGIEKKIEGSSDTIARDLRSMVSVVRGTLMQQAKNLTDEQVENLTNSYTYANPRYWDQYYNKTGQSESYDWYVTWDSKIENAKFRPRDKDAEIDAMQLQDIMKPYVATTHKIMMFGCGNSDISEKMYESGYEDITNIDVSAAVMDRMRNKHAESKPKMSWLVEDASKLSFSDNAFDVTIDKGTLDAIEQNAPLVKAAVKEAHRTLKVGGLFISVTFNNQDIRVAKQLGDVTNGWEQCWTHKFIKPPLEGSESAKGERKQYYFHVCEKK
eukprot:gnl/MRDRNA2_/MRDRNA2_117716_c0_seq1.p1 gnl/MRDRNA2_/MRDRNA2_117716_c0~~gnl/MRDRNA2_/MRDRNA2_117716_c0_seq1.p1  ORF type:complete len:395 (+),score=101.62 gnl/MRDRNA2_/MRDRNA2_117716_c0_seq1:84-1268(+)